MASRLLLLAAGVAAVALARRGGLESPRAGCVDKWARFLADQQDEMLGDDSEGRAEYATAMEAAGWPNVARCARRSGDCFAAYRDDLLALPPAGLLEQAQYARAAGLEEVATCLEQMATGAA